MGLAGFEPTSF